MSYDIHVISKHWFLCKISNILILYFKKKLHKSFKTQPDSIVLNQGCHILQSIFIDKGTYVTSPFVKWNITVG